MVGFFAGFRPATRFSSCDFPLPRRNSPLKPDETLEVIGEVDHADFGCDPRDSDGSDEEFHLSLLPGKDMLDEGANLGAFAVCFGGTF